MIWCQQSVNLLLLVDRPLLCCDRICRVVITLFIVVVVVVGVVVGTQTGKVNQLIITCSLLLLPYLIN